MKDEHINNRPLAELAAGERMLEDSGAQNRSVRNVHEDSSTESPTQLPAAVELCKRSNEKIRLRSAQVEKALTVLEKAINMPMQEDRINIDASIQRFEFTVELFWNLLKGLLEAEGIDKHSPKSILMSAYAGHMINDENTWLDMLRDRNRTSHTYNEKLADEIYLRIKKYAQVLRSEFGNLKKKYELN